MHRVAFDWDSQARGALRIVVDGRDLTDLARDVELASAEAEGHPEIAGSYLGVRTDQLGTSLREHFMGGKGTDLGCGPEGKTVLLGCECGELGCWPLMARIDVREGEIVWSDFEQPHRADSWSYQALGPIGFERNQYEDALARAERTSALR